MNAVAMRDGRWPLSLSGDKGYSVTRIRDWLKRNRIKDVIARRRDQRQPGDDGDFDTRTYRRRNVVERCVGWLKECRRIATRFEKLAVNFLAMLKLGFIRRYLRLLNERPV